MRRRRRRRCEAGRSCSSSRCGFFSGRATRVTLYYPLGMNADLHNQQAPSPWVVRWADRVPAQGRVLDLACGSGRHARYFAGRGCTVEAVDRDAAALASLEGLPGITTRCADLEGGLWPYGNQFFSAIVVTNYLH